MLWMRFGERKSVGFISILAVVVQQEVGHKHATGSPGEKLVDYSTRDCTHALFIGSLIAENVVEKRKCGAVIATVSREMAHCGNLQIRMATTDFRVGILEKFLDLKFGDEFRSFVMDYCYDGHGICTNRKFGGINNVKNYDKKSYNNVKRANNSGVRSALSSGQSEMFKWGCSISKRTSTKTVSKPRLHSNPTRTRAGSKAISSNGRTPTPAPLQMETDASEDRESATLSPTQATMKAAIQGEQNSRVLLKNNKGPINQHAQEKRCQLKTPSLGQCARVISRRYRRSRWKRPNVKRKVSLKQAKRLTPATNPHPIAKQSANYVGDTSPNFMLIANTSRRGLEKNIKLEEVTVVREPCMELNSFQEKDRIEIEMVGGVGSYSAPSTFQGGGEGSSPCGEMTQTTDLVENADDPNSPLLGNQLQLEDSRTFESCVDTMNVELTDTQWSGKVAAENSKTSATVTATGESCNDNPRHHDALSFPESWNALCNERGVGTPSPMTLINGGEHVRGCSYLAPESMDRSQTTTDTDLLICPDCGSPSVKSPDGYVHVSHPDEECNSTPNYTILETSHHGSDDIDSTTTTLCINEEEDIYQTCNGHVAASLQNNSPNGYVDDGSNQVSFQGFIPAEYHPLSTAPEGFPLPGLVPGSSLIDLVPPSQFCHKSIPTALTSAAELYVEAPTFLTVAPSEQILQQSKACPPGTNAEAVISTETCPEEEERLVGHSLPEHATSGDENSSHPLVNPLPQQERTNKKIKCSACSKVMLETSLKRHAQLTCKVLRQYLKNWRPPKQDLACTLEGCGYIPNSLRQYKKHLLLHPPKRKLACPNCHKTFAEQLSLQEHTRTYHHLRIPTDITLISIRSNKRFQPQVVIQKMSPEEIAEVSKR